MNLFTAISNLDWKPTKIADSGDDVEDEVAFQKGFNPQ